MPKLIALLIGIDRYPVSIPSLRGCVHDMHAFRDYLGRQCQHQQYTYLPLSIENEAATRNSIIQSFGHFSQAQDGDICVLYFSGHGSRIPAPQFWESSNGLNETTLCADSTLQDGSKDLIDKEWSWLIFQATKGKMVHFLAVMDCCHSGSNTRNGNLPVGIRQVQPRNLARPIGDYLGADDYVKDAQGKYSAPKASHLSFGACRSFQTAKEIAVGGQIRGAFTLSLVEALEYAQDTPSYADLEGLVARKIANRTFDQLPQLDAVAGADSKQPFLGGAMAPRQHYYVSWNERSQRWELDAGFIHGISTSPVSSQLTLIGLPNQLRIKTVLPAATIVEGMDGLDTSRFYAATVSGGAAGAQSVAPAPGSKEASVQRLQIALQNAPSPYVQWESNPANATYWVHIKNGKYLLSLAGSDQPLFNPIPITDNLSDETLWKEVHAVLQWQHVSNLENPRSGIRNEEFSIELWRSEEGDYTSFQSYTRCPDWQNPAPFCWTRVNGSAVPPGFAFKIQNKGARPLYVSCPLLSARYGISNFLLQGERLDPGASAWMSWTDESGQSRREIGLTIEDAHWKAGFTDMTDFIQVFISTDPLSTDRFNQDDLELDQIRVRTKGTITRSAMLPGKAMPAFDWTTRRIPLRIIRPADAAMVHRGLPASLDTIHIVGPTGFSASVQLAGEAQATRGFPTFPNPPALDGFRPLALSPGFGRTIGSAVLELRGVEGIETISKEAPLSLSISSPDLLDEGELALPLGYDLETGIWVPLGLPGNAHTPMRITNLPDPTPTGERAIGESILLFLYKVSAGKPGFQQWLQQTAGVRPLFRLAAVRVGADEQATTIQDNPAEIRKLVEQDAVQRILLITHGIIGDTRDSVGMVQRIKDPNNPTVALQDAYDLVLTFDYENLGTDIDEIARMLGNLLHEAGLGAGHGKTLHVVAHSMGGLVARWFIEREGGNQVVSALVQLGTPNGGTKLYKAYDALLFLLTQAINFLPVPEIAWELAGTLARKASLDSVDNTFLMMKPGSAFLKKLAASPDPGVPYFVLAGNTQLSPAAKKGLGKVLQQLGYRALDALFRGPNDLAVAVTDIHKIPEARHIPAQKDVLACDHLAYFHTPASLEVLGATLWKLLRG
ncbi:MAG: caspase family protein [Haliscomenobacter sp.]